ncbi:MAG TPA: double-strand break repair helicase AddA [Dongiaceae bacterium]|nr:double-strand break repair helicase AddA [Dongiaceae bacterium]
MDQHAQLEAIDFATRAQRLGADPARSAWVTASAGSGKTKVLGDRVLRLLLDGTRPERILCLTFTKAAAAEMANRIAETLARWASMPQAELRNELDRLLGRKPSAETLSDARRLFSRVLDAPGGMKIETIHAFCQSLLRRFPLEAEIAPHFQPMEERDTAEQLRAARDAMLIAAQLDAGSPLAAALAHVVRLGEDRLDRIMDGFRRNHAKLRLLQQRSGGLAAIGRVMARLLDLREGETRETILQGGCAEAAFDGAGLRAAVALALEGKVTDQKLGHQVATWLAGDLAVRVTGFDDYCAAFHDSKGQPKSAYLTKALQQASPAAEDALLQERDRLIRLHDRVKAADILANSQALLTLAFDMLRRYERRKALRAELDFDDLITKTRDLLQRPGIAPWVLYKLDGGIDHILVDEAQDTNPMQWQVIEALAGEFFTGIGAVDRNRTIFAVGDVKQSIYSFQGADPTGFIRMRAQFAEMAGVERFSNVLLDVSFRSTDHVLGLVDRVFALPGAAPGVVLPGDPVLRHRVSRIGAAGEVRLWPRAIPVDADMPAPWSPPRVREEAAAPVARLADAIAAECQRLIREARLADQDRPVQAGDILILARSRNVFFDAVVRALKARDVPVAGIDRMHLLEQIAVQDLLAFADFLLLPEDDLTLACLLKSPLVGLGEEDLMRLCLDRGELSLWSMLALRASEDRVFAEAYEMLGGFLDRADYLTPFALYSDLLAAAGGRRKLYSRLGLEAADAVDEFMSLAQAYEQRETPSLQGFVHWLRSNDVEVKRETQERADQVRIMTIHGAKGLQAPIVFLVDQQRRAPADDGLFWIEAGGVELPLWSPRRAADHALTAAARLRREQAAALEENRLLYVALTRAEDRLYVCGIGSGAASAKPGWYDHVAEAMAAIPGVEELELSQMAGDGWLGTARRISSEQRVEPRRRAAAVEASASAATELPDWLTRTAPDEPDPPQPLTPSRPSAAETAAEPALVSPLAADQGYRFKRGRLLHHLLETLPEIPLAGRPAAAAAYLARPIHALTTNQQVEISMEVFAVLAHPDFAPLFGSQSQAEVPVVATLRDREGRSRILAGQIDRLALVGDDCLIVDYKSNRPPPMQVAQVPLPYLRQMAAYRTAVRLIYPDKTVRCVLLWSDGPRLMEVPPDMLDLHA